MQYLRLPKRNGEGIDRRTALFTGAAAVLALAGCGSGAVGAPTPIVAGPSATVTATPTSDPNAGWLSTANADYSSFASDVAAVSADCADLMSTLCQSDIPKGENDAAALYHYLANPPTIYADASATLKAAANAYGDGFNQMALVQSYGLHTSEGDPYVLADLQKGRTLILQVASPFQAS